MRPTFTVMDIRIHQRKVIAAVGTAQITALEKCGLAVEREAKRLLSKGGGGAHTPSLPGMPPHVQTGALRASVSHAMTVREGCIVGPTEKYGKFHEYGTRKLPKRPFMRPALRNSMGLFPSRFRDIV